MDSVKCRNCGNYGHKLRNCKFPRLSYGIVLFNDKNEIVMIEKHDSISYIEFIRGKYKIEDKYVIYVALISPILTYLINIQFDLGFEILMINGLITFIGLDSLRKDTYYWFK